MPILAITFPVVDPVALEVGPLVIRWYALAYVAGLVLGWLYIRYMVSRHALWPWGQSPMTTIDADDLLAWVAVGVVVGGRIGFVLFYNPGFYLAQPLEILKVWHGGMSFHGGLIGTLLVLVLFARRRGIPIWSVFDVVAAAVPIGLFFGRIANFINGELWGRPSDLPWAVIFPAEAAGGIPRHPSQIYEAILEGAVLLAILTVLVQSHRALTRPGLVAGTFLFCYGIARTVVETMREPDQQIGFILGGLTMGQILSFPMILIGAAVMARALARPSQTAQRAIARPATESPSPDRT